MYRVKHTIGWVKPMLRKRKGKNRVKATFTVHFSEVRSFRLLVSANTTEMLQIKHRLDLSPLVVQGF